jgi:uncharacterized protein (DUF697 family)
MNGPSWKAYTQPLRRCLDGEFDGASDEEKERAVEDLIRMCSSAAGAIVVQPIPVVDAFLLPPIHLRMVQGIGRIHGYLLDKKGCRQVVRPLGGRLFRMNAAIAGAKLVPLVPLIGDIIAISIAYALTSAIGELSDRYFRTGRTMLPADVRTAFDSIYRETYEKAYRRSRSEMKAIWRSMTVRRPIEAEGVAEGRPPSDPTERGIGDQPIVNPPRSEVPRGGAPRAAW